MVIAIIKPDLSFNHNKPSTFYYKLLEELKNGNFIDFNSNKKEIRPYSNSIIQFTYKQNIS